MKVRIIETVEVDAEAWAESYGLDLKDVRDDVKYYFTGYCQRQVEHVGCDVKNPTDESK